MLSLSRCRSASRRHATRRRPSAGAQLRRGRADDGRLRRRRAAAAELGAEVVANDQVKRARPAAGAAGRCCSTAGRPGDAAVRLGRRACACSSCAAATIREPAGAPTFDEVEEQLQRGAGQPARPALPARPAARCGDRLSLKMARGAPRGLARRSGRDRPGSHRQVLGQRAAAVGFRRSSRSATRAALEAVWDGPIAIIDDPGDAAGVFDQRAAADPDRRRRPTPPGGPTWSAPAARSTRSSWRSGWPARARPRAWSPARCPRSSSTRSASAHPGQTEFVAERCGVSRRTDAMMLAGPTLRTVPVTTHLPLAGRARGADRPT